jgi:ADP-ribosyl-[dinitrogen reductase] hydrolase
MKMPGGGTYGLKPGQFTDDSEMASHLTLGLLHFDPNQPLNAQLWELTRRIALEYIRWMRGEPFDVGLTCRRGISQLQHHRKTL